MNLGRTRWLTLLAISLGISMIIVDATIVNVAIPSIVRDLDLDGSGAEWIVSVYPLIFAGLLITLGRTGDIVGRKRLHAVVPAIEDAFTQAARTAGLAAAAFIGLGLLFSMRLPDPAPATDGALETGRDVAPRRADVLAGVALTD